MKHIWNVLPNSHMHRLCVGSYTSFPESPGIQVFHLNPVSGKAELLCSQSVSQNPSFLAFNCKNLYAVNEVMEGNCIDTYVWKDAYKELRHIGRLYVPGSAMCHVCLWPNGKFLSVSNYMSGNFAVCSLNQEGIPIKIVQVVQYTGIGYDAKGRQERSHVHSTTPTPDGRSLFTADLGLDRLRSYHTDLTSGLLPACVEEISTQAGDGPRHMVFSPDQNHYYLLTEMGNRIYGFRYDCTAKRSYHIQTISTLEADFTEKNMAADIQITKDGQFLYASNRGCNNLVGFWRDLHSGSLTKIGVFPLAGKGPRTFNISADGRLVAVACQESGNVLLYRRENETGMIGELLEDIRVPQAAFAAFLEL